MEHRPSDPEVVLAELSAPSAGDPGRAARRWADSGAMAVTGPADGPARQVPVSVTSRLDLAAHTLARLGGPTVDGPALLGERAAIARFGRRGDVSVGGQARLLDAADGPVCLNLARPDDLAALPAWLGAELDPSDWKAVTSEVGRRSGVELAERADLLGLPVGVPGTARHLDPALLTPGGETKGREGPPLVVEFGSLWAGPLCAGLLRQAGCRVIKVESAERPDGARRGPRLFFDLLNEGKESVVVDPRTTDGRGFIRRLVDRAAVVVEASRPRALRQWGLDAETEVGGGTVWVSITGYGRVGPRSGGVAFGDDAAVSGGLLLDNPIGFVADAPADPAGGLVAAVLALAGVADPAGWLVDVPLAGVAAWLAGDSRVPDHPAEVGVAPPRARRVGESAAGLGADTEKVAASLGS